MIEYQIQIWLHAELSGGWSVSLPQLPGVVSQGETREEATANISEAFKGAAESYLESDGEIPWIDSEPGHVPKGAHERFIIVEVEPPAPPKPKRGVAAIIGKWPGDETDEEVEAAIAEMKAKCPHCNGTGEIEVTIATNAGSKTAGT